MGDGATAMAHGGGRRSGWSAPVRWAAGIGVREKSLAVFGPDAVTPAGATIPSWRVSVISIPHLPPRAGETLGHVRAAASLASLSFLEVLFCTQWSGALGCSGLSLVGVAVAGHPCSVELPLLAFAFSSFSFGLVVLFAPAILYRCWLLWNTKRGETLFRYSDGLVGWC